MASSIWPDFKYVKELINEILNRWVVTDVCLVVSRDTRLRMMQCRDNHMRLDVADCSLTSSIDFTDLTAIQYADLLNHLPGGSVHCTVHTISMHNNYRTRGTNRRYYDNTPDSDYPEIEYDPYILEAGPFDPGW